MNRLTAATLLFFICFFSPCLQAQTPFTQVSVDPFNKENFLSVVIDYNNDGLDDVIGWQYHVPQSTKIYRNNGNSSFTDVTANLNFPSYTNSLAKDVNDVVPRDFNKDGFMDVYFLRADTLRITYNLRTGFTTPAAGRGYYKLGTLFNTDSSNISQVRIFDFDGDGVYDITACIKNGATASLKARKGQMSCSNNPFDFRADSLFTLIDINRVNETDFQFADVDNDGDFDLLLSISNPDQYSNSSYAIYTNNGGTYSLNTASGYNVGRKNAFGTLGEFNNDGIPDIVSGAADCCVGNNPLYVYFSSGPGVYNASTTAMQRSLNPYYWGATVVDLNLDRKQDVVFTDMPSIGNEALQFFSNNGNNTFTESAALLGINHGPVAGGCCPITNFQKSTVLDINNDKRPDVDIHEIDVSAPYTVINSWQMLNTAANNSVKLKLSACRGLKEGWGARIKYKTGGTWTYLQHTAYASSNYPFLYLGMGPNAVIDSIVINWIGGATTIAKNIMQGSYVVMQENASCSYGSLTTYNPFTDSTLVAAESSILDAGEDFKTYAWNTGATTRQITVTKPGTYNVTVTNAAGCSATDATYVSFLQKHSFSFVDLEAKQQGDVVNVTWKTKKEVDVDHYNITKSSDGNRFVKIGSTPATGAKKYRFTDQQPLKPGAHTLYYRLEIVGKEGGLTFSPVATVLIGKVRDVFTLSPNPAKNSVSLFFEADHEKASIQVYNSTGMKVRTQTVNANSRTATLKTENLPSGIYIVVLEKGTEIQQQRLIISK